MQRQMNHYVACAGDKNLAVRARKQAAANEPELKAHSQLDAFELIHHARDGFIPDWSNFPRCHAPFRFVIFPAT
jgi:hypothetical protein